MLHDSTCLGLFKNFNQSTSHFAKNYMPGQKNNWQFCDSPQGCDLPDVHWVQRFIKRLIKRDKKK